MQSLSHIQCQYRNIKDIYVGADDDHYCFDVVAAGLDGLVFAELGPLCLPLPLFATAIARRTKGQSGKVVCTYISKHLKGWLIINITFCLRTEVRASL